MTEEKNELKRQCSERLTKIYVEHNIVEIAHGVEGS